MIGVSCQKILRLGIVISNSNNRFAAGFKIHKRMANFFKFCDASTLCVAGVYNKMRNATVITGSL